MITSPLICGYVPELFELILEHLTIECIKPTTSKDELYVIELTKRVVYELYLGKISLLIDTIRLWSTEIKLYAQQNFFPFLPQDIKDKYNI